MIINKIPCHKIEWWSYKYNHESIIVILKNMGPSKLEKEAHAFTNQERGEDSKESTKAKNN